MSKTETINFKIGDKYYKVECANEEKTQLLEAVEILNRKLNQIGAVNERNIIMIALNQTFNNISLRDKLQKIQQKIDLL